MLLQGPSRLLLHAVLPARHTPQAPHPQYYALTDPGRQTAPALQITRGQAVWDAFLDEAMLLLDEGTLL